MRYGQSDARPAQDAPLGVLVSGSLQVSDNGQAAQFFPSAPFPNGTLVQVFVLSSAQSSYGVSMNNYQSSFIVVADTSAAVPTLIASNPLYESQGLPTNIVIDLAFNVALDPTWTRPDGGAASFKLMYLKRPYTML